MKKTPRHIATVNRIKPVEGVGIVLLSLGALLVFLWALIAVVRLVLG